MAEQIGIVIMGVTVGAVGGSVEALPSPVPCVDTGSVPLLIKDDWMEKEVIMGFRVWQLMFLAMAGFITVVVLLCCFMKCRVPRTKQEIEADFKRKEITRRFRFLLDRVQIEDTSLRTAIEKVSELYTNREKTKRRKRKKMEDEEENISIGSSYLFVDEKLTIKDKVRKLLGLLDDNASDTDSMKETTDKSEELLKRSTSVDDELSSLPDVKVALDLVKTRQTSEESTDSPKLADSHSKISILQESPPRTHDTLSRLSLLQDSPPNYGCVTLLEDTPPAHQPKKPEDKDGEDLKKGLANRTSESQDSQDSNTLGKKQDSLESDKSSRLLRLKSDSQGSEGNGKNKNKKSDSQDSEKTKFGKQKSDSQDSNDSYDGKAQKGTLKKMFQPQESKLTRRESVSGQSAVDKWRKSPKKKNKNEKGTKSLDINLSGKS